MTTETKYSVVMIRKVYSPDKSGRGAPVIAGDWYCGGKIKHEGLTLDQARQIVADYDRADYVTGGGEHSRPDYVIVTDNKAAYYTEGRNGDLGNYYWEDDDCACGECDKCISMMIDQDIDDIMDCKVD